MSLEDVLAADAANVFLNTGDFAISLARNPGGNKALAETILGVFNEDEEGVLQGMLIDEPSGRRFKRFAYLEISNQIGVALVERPEGRDSFTIPGPTGNEDWWAIRVEGRDSFAGGLMTLIIGRAEKIATSPK